ncbi:HRDC domain-containing protein [Jonesia quinghaiensis]|uniref:HRDC domain-containing protein n=1 Tax=Jonesia quinghaiensis TaxID=262806 RepID=UPI00055A1465|nr:HRDC domain-containing protein [Jonesia quinghaiensis]
MSETSTPPSLPVLTEPSDGPVDLVTTALGYGRALRLLASGEGPFAVDAERASGYRYGNRNYLIQVRREGAGTFLIDPIAVPDLSDLNALMADDPWIFHAATQDLGPLRAQGLHAPSVFDTEIAARLLGVERVNLAAVTSHFLGVSLEKQHSHQDWSTRPLPPEWLTYAALDVELLAPLARSEHNALQESGKLQWAYEEFEYVRTLPTIHRPDPWRRTSGIQRITDRRRMAVVKNLWEEREKIAQARDIAPSRILPDRAIIEAAVRLPRSVGALLALHEFGGNAHRRRAHQWQRAISQALVMPQQELPPLRVAAPPKAPPAKFWFDKNPLAARRYDEAREFIDSLAEKYTMPAENIIQPKLVRQLLWDATDTHVDVAQYLGEQQARPWQISLVGDTLHTIIQTVTTP